MSVFECRKFNELRRIVSMLLDSEKQELIESLLDTRKKLLWLLEQTPTNDEQRRFIKRAKEMLEQVDDYLRYFNVELPS